MTLNDQAAGGSCLAAMHYNTACPAVHVNLRTLEVEIDGQVVDIPPAEALPMTTRFFIA